MATPRIEGVRRSRSRTGSALLGLVLLCAAPAAAQKDLGPVVLSGEVELGGRLVWGDENNAKFQEYRDLRDGLIGSFDLLVEDSDIEHWLRARSENTGYDDQRYWLEGGRYGRYRIEGFYGELPYFTSNLSQTPYLRSGNDFQFPSFVDRNAIEAACADDPDLPPLCNATVDAQLAPAFQPKNIKLKWTEGRVGGEYHVDESTTLRASYRIQDKQGNRTWGMGFGTPGGTFITLPARVDEKIHEARAGVDWHREDSSFTVEYLGNFYDDDLGSVIGANPLVPANTLTDDADQGRASVPPDNWAQSLLLSGSTRLPIEMPNRIAASFAYGFRYQDDKFLPDTINPRITNPALPQNSLDGQVQTLLGNLVATAQPAPDVGVKLRYRVFDYENLTDSITFPEWVLNDTNEEDDPLTSIHNDYLRQNANLDVHWDFAESWTGSVGFGFEGWNRSKDREVEDLYEYGPDLNLDYRTRKGTILHTGYQFRSRDGSSYRPFAPVEKKYGFDCNEDPIPTDCSAVKFFRMRKFTEADRYLHRFALLGKITPLEDLELTFSSDVGYADYHDSSFGLEESLDWDVGADVFYQIHPRISLIAYYTYQWQRYRQNSRERPRNFVPPIVITDDPLNNWKSRTLYQYHNAEAIVRFALLPDKLDAEFGYLVQAGKESTHASGDQGAAVDYPNVHDLLQAVSATLTWNVLEEVSLSAGYRYEDYDIQNFRSELIPASLLDASNDLYLGAVIKDYTANVFVMSATLRF
jgi:MtrB/PioB family decaheme-associated outer membrane protein